MYFPHNKLNDMARKLIIMLCLGAMALGMSAQKGVDARIKQIREAYANRLAMMQNQPYDDETARLFISLLLCLLSSS